MRPANVYTCRSALRGLKEKTARAWRQRDVEQPVLEQALESLGVIDENQIWFGNAVEGGCEGCVANLDLRQGEARR